MTGPGALAIASLRRGPHHVNIHGHRGACGEMPENTLPGFEHALDAGLRILEFDVRISADGTPVIIHDACLNQDITQGADGAFLSAPTPQIMNLGDIALASFKVGRIRPGSAYARRYPHRAQLPGVRVPALAALCAVLQRKAAHNVWLGLEIKSGPVCCGHTPPMQPFVEAILSVVRQYGLCGQLFIQSFDWQILQCCARLAPEIPLCFISAQRRAGRTGTVNIHSGSPLMAGAPMPEGPGDLPRIIAAAGGKMWSAAFEDISRKGVLAARRADLVINAWTVNDIADIDRMIDLGVDGIVTDFPSRVLHRLRAFGLAGCPPAPQ